MSLVLGGRTRDSQVDGRIRGGARVAVRDGAGPGAGGGCGNAPSGLVEQWLRVSDQTGAPLDPLLWAEGPLSTTYPACMAVKAAAEQAKDGAYGYLRRLREAIMCERRKLDTAEPLVEEARAAGLDVERFRSSLRSHAITEAFGADLEATEALAGEAQDPAGRSSEGRGGVPLPTAVFAGGERPPARERSGALCGVPRGGRGVRRRAVGERPDRGGTGARALQPRYDGRGRSCCANCRAHAPRPSCGGLRRDGSCARCRC